MNLKEQQIIRRIRHGDIAAFEKLFHQYYPVLCTYSESLVGVQEVAEEVVQDVFFNIWKNREKLYINHTLKGYLFRSAYNNSMMHLRKMRREFFLEDAGIRENGWSSPDPSQILQLDEVAGLVRRTLEQMPERTREIFRLNRYEGLKYKEVAVKLGISEKTVEAHMGRALKALKNCVEKYEQE